MSTSLDTGMADCFYRSCRSNVHCVGVVVSPGAGFEEIIDALNLAHPGQDFRARRDKGVFEIQTDAGIWSRFDDSDREIHNPKYRKFKTWAELDAENPPRTQAELLAAEVQP